MPVPSHDACLKLLANPSTQNILETFGYEYSVAGQDAFRSARQNIVPALVKAIVTELALDPVFPPRYRLHLPEIGLYIENRADGCAVINIEKPSVVDEYVHPTAEGAARSYIYKSIDSYWLAADIEKFRLRR
jgi:hypothetical protein